ncbi:glycosyltransferase family 2 protein [Haladaptatus caseinilyticus]|uniref:glycosyltransferase family 2 protein n=1 Tax=Haladaptatus caseinilyticus TaxID=2993314 RepID=UPI00224AEC51|nr:glycosyltransferase family 2 protein [Haladaptatus caseinilyticus]
MTIDRDEETSTTDFNVGEATGILDDREEFEGIDPMLSVVLPTKDEEGGIAESIEQARAAIQAVGLPGEIIVSDSSTDRTPEIARKMGATVVKPDKPGYGYAYRYAFEHARGEYIVIGDADNTYDFRELPELLPPVLDGSADIVLGSRLSGTIEDGAMPWLHKHVGNPILTKFVNVFYSAGISDAHSGFRVISRDALDRLDLKTDGMEFATEMVVDARSKGLTLEDVPITYHPRTGEAKLNTFHDGWRHVRFMLLYAPGYLFSIPAIIVALIGATFMGLSLFDTQFVGSILGTQFDLFFGLQMLLVGGVLTLAGIQVGTLGIFLAAITVGNRYPKDTVTRWMNEHLNPNYGIYIGSVFTLVGSIMMSSRMITRNVGDLNSLSISATEIVLFILVVVGVQMLATGFYARTLLAREGVLET